MEQLKRYYRVFIGEWQGERRALVDHLYTSRGAAGRAVLQEVRREFKRHAGGLVFTVVPDMLCAVEEVQGDLVIRTWEYALYGRDIELHCIGSLKLQHIHV